MCIIEKEKPCDGCGNCGERNGIEETTFDNLSLGDVVKILRGRSKGKIGRVIDMDEHFNQVDVKLASGLTKYLGFEDLKIVGSNQDTLNDKQKPKDLNETN